MRPTKVKAAKAAPATKERFLVFTHSQQDAIAKALMEACSDTGFSNTGPWQREGIELARQALIRMLERTGMAYDHARFSSATQPLASAMARDKEVDLRDIEVDDKYDKEDKDDETIKDA